MNNINFFAHTTQLKGSKHSLNVLLENFSCYSYREWKFTWIFATGLRSIAIIISNCICSLNVITLGLLKVHSTILCEMKFSQRKNIKTHLQFRLFRTHFSYLFLCVFCSNCNLLSIRIQLPNICVDISKQWRILLIPKCRFSIVHVSSIPISVDSFCNLSIDRDTRWSNVINVCFHFIKIICIVILLTIA